MKTRIKELKKEIIQLQQHGQELNKAMTKNNVSIIQRQGAISELERLINLEKKEPK